ncbi:MAG TPA: hypothetical protein VNH83_27975 [Bryobacteraceae bacterium]|nr:hypothetical protein [Bryobacteraceae bacterium]
MEVTAEFMAMAKANMERGQLKEALFDLDNALYLMPKSIHAHCNRAQALLSLGDYRQGFAEFEWRLALFGDVFIGVDVPVWRGEPLVGKRLLLGHEHGYGDSLMMLRYVPVLRDMGAEITLLVPPGLKRLASQFGIDVRDQYPDDYSIFDYRCPMFSIVNALGHDVNDIPSQPYIGTVDGERIPSSIGIAWSGNRKHLRDAHRSVGIEQFLSLLEHDHTLYAVQNTELDEAAERGVVTQGFEDLVETAVFMSRLDHIVTVDSAPAHLAGAIGHPSVHLLLPYVSDWRWYNAKAWYPNVKTYWQDRPGDWASVFAKLTIM